jgi:predicted phosphodiesterase
VDIGDWARNYADTEHVRLAARAIYVLHDLKTLRIDPVAEGIDIIVSGHSHKAAIETIDGMLYLNVFRHGIRTPFSG